MSNICIMFSPNFDYFFFSGQQLDDNAERNEGAYNVQGFLGAHSHEIRRKCRNGECDMYGSFEFEFFCSKCFKERPMLVERDMLSVW